MVVTLEMGQAERQLRRKEFLSGNHQGFLGNSLVKARTKERLGTTIAKQKGPSVTRLEKAGTSRLFCLSDSKNTSDNVCASVLRKGSETSKIETKFLTRPLAQELTVWASSKENTTS